MALLQIDWSGIFALDTSPLELVVRGTVMYFVLLVFHRMVPRRTVGSISIMDLILVVLIAEAAGKAMGDYNSIGAGVILVATLFWWTTALNWLTYAVPAIERLLSPSLLPVVSGGRLLRRNMRTEFLTEAELTQQLRLKGIEDLSEVKAAFVESDGSLSVITYKSNDGR